jgi:hypothetical protein
MEKLKNFSDYIYELARLILMALLCIQAREWLILYFGKNILQNGNYLTIMAFILGITIYLIFISIF